MSYRVWFTCNQGKYYLTRDCFLGYGSLTKSAKEASHYREPLTRKDIEEFLKDEMFDITVLACGNEKVIKVKTTCRDKQIYLMQTIKERHDYYIDR